MPTDVPNRPRTTARRRRRRSSTPAATTRVVRSAPTRALAPTPTRPAPSRRTSEVRDVKSDADRGRATRYKRTKQYKRDVREAYRAQPVRRRRELVKAARTLPNTVESQVILREAGARRNRARQLERSAATKDTKGDRDRGRGAAQFQKDRTERIERQERNTYLKELAANPATSSIVPLLTAANKTEFGRDALDLLLGTEKATRQAGKALLPDWLLPGDNGDAKVRQATTRSLPGAAKGAVGSIVGGVAALGRDIASPVTKDEFGVLPRYIGKLAKEGYEGLAERGEEATTDPKKFQETLRETGALPELTNITGALMPVAGLTGRAATAAARRSYREGSRGRVASTLGAPRPALRVEEGNSPYGRREQKASKQVTRRVVQSLRDDLRRAGTNKQLDAMIADPTRNFRGLKPQAPDEVVRLRRPGTSLGNLKLPLLTGQKADLERGLDELQANSFSRKTIRGNAEVKGIRRGGESIGIRAELHEARKQLKRGSQRDAVDVLEPFLLRGFLSLSSVAASRRALDELENLIKERRPVDAVVLPHADVLKGIADARKVLARPDAKEILAVLKPFHEKQVARAGRQQDYATIDRRGSEVRRHASVARIIRTPDGRRLSDAYKQKIDKIGEDADKGRISRRQAERLLREAEDTFVAAVKTEVKRKGLAEPVYVKDRHDDMQEASDFSAGSLARVVPGHKVWEGKLLETGRFDLRPEAYEAGVMATIKREANWEAVADARTRFAIKRKEKGRETDEGTPHEWREHLRKNRLDPADYKLARLSISRDTPGASTDPDVVQEVKTYDLFGNDAELNQTSGFQLVPRPVAERLESLQQSSSAGGRALDKTMGGLSRLILSTSPVYIPVQVGSQLLTSIPMTQGRVIPELAREILPGKSRLENASPAALEFVDSLIGVSPSSSMSSTPNLGSRAPGTSVAQKLSYGSKAFLDRETLKAMSDAKWNPLAWNRLMDQAQNQAFRRSAFYAVMRKQNARSMMETLRGVAPRISKLEKILEMPAGPAQARMLRKHEADFMEVAREVDKMLGNWTRFSPFERRVMKRAFLFYGFLRYATKFALYTMPFEHPTATAILMNLGQLQNEEIIDLLSLQVQKEAGGNVDRKAVERAIRKDMISQIGGRLYYSSDGKLAYFDTAKLNPATGPIVEFMGNPKKAFFGLMNPLVQSIFNVGFGEKAATGARLNTRGLQTEYGDKPDRGFEIFGRVMIRDLLRASPLIRGADEAIADPSKVQGDDSIPMINDRPLLPTSANEFRKQQEKAARKPKDRLARVLKTTVTPVAVNDKDTPKRIMDSVNIGDANRAEADIKRIRQEYIRSAKTQAEADRAQERADRDPRVVELRKVVSEARKRRQPRKRKRSRPSGDPFQGGAMRDPFAGSGMKDPLAP